MTKNEKREWKMLTEQLTMGKELRQPIVSKSLSPIVPTEIRIMEKAREDYGIPPYTDGEECAFAEGARWMKKMLLGDNVC